jgi:hypothetical protein
MGDQSTDSLELLGKIESEIESINTIIENNHIQQ